MAPSALDALFEQAADAHRHGDRAGAEKLCREIVIADPNHLRALYALATLAYDRGDYDAAEGYAARVVALSPQIAEAQNLRGMAQHALGRLADAADSFAAAAALLRDPTEPLYNRGCILFALGRFEEALSCYDAALSRAPDDAIIANNRGNALRALHRFADALAAYDCALAVDPSFAGAHNNRGIVLQSLGRTDEALASFDRAIAHDPRDAEALYNRGLALASLRRFGDALASHGAALALQPVHADAAGAAFGVAATLCDWRNWRQRTADIAAHIRNGAAIGPLTVIAFSDDPGLQAQAARNVANAFARVAAAASPIAARPARPRIRLAYLSGDFRNHVTGHTLVDLFEHHDRDRFELWGISLIAAPDSAIGRRLTATFDHFIDAARLSDGATASLLREHEIDIAVDLMGHIENARLGIFANRAAPLQVNYFGHPGTAGADFIDYVIGDRIAIPETLAEHFNEQIVRLPHCYLPSAATPIMAERPDRRAHTLPADAFVFCNFNSSQKITPPVFDIWMRLLAQIEGSVLWLYAGEESQANLCREAVARGVESDRLVFAPPIERQLHLARVSAADLFLDTVPYNAHNTATETLWAGVPLVTCTGNSMAARVATSVLATAGLPELAVRSLADYEALALSLALAPDRLAALRARLAAARESSALFDLTGYCRHLEAAYVAMVERHRRGAATAGFTVAP
ncbi:MAG TPA: tetratricopeptide repeat protein [Stellaceae bacterium]|jgi:predicted O-linked N-acetylglucosamine transferase (SPINDLY family)